MRPILSFPRADSWDGEYVRSGVQILGELTDNEDMFLWRDDRGGVHMLTHSQDNSHHNHERRGGYAFSPDNGLSWKLSKVRYALISSLGRELTLYSFLKR